jgi:capsular exopolysaccharide synthesis family protein
MAGNLTHPAPTNVPLQLGPRRDEIDFALVAGVLRRRWMLLVACIGLGLGGAFLYASLVPRTYQATTSLRVDPKLGNLPEVYRTVSEEGELATEMEVLRSHSLAEAVVDSLGLQLRVTKPRRVWRTALVSDVHVTQDADTGTYRFVPRSDGGFTVTAGQEANALLVRVLPGSQVRLPGVSFRLADSLPVPDGFVVHVDRLQDAVQRFRENLDVMRSGTESKIVTARYQDTDPSIVRSALNALTGQYLQRRQNEHRIEARSTAAFIEGQLDTLQPELKQAEDELRAFQERSRVVAPEVEGTTQVTRLAALQAERGGVEAERQALAHLLEEVNASSASDRPGGASSVRRLIAFPTLLRTNAASQLLGSLAAVEEQRSELLKRRLPADPEVRFLDARIREQEDKLQGMAEAYLQGLTNQVAALDSTMAGFQRELATVPAKAVRFARLEREPKRLEEMVELLQTRLKETRIAEAAQDPSVQVVDPAIAPSSPHRPRLPLSLAFGLFLGALLGGGAVFLREYRDNTVHTRYDVHWATGIPVLGLVPHLQFHRRRRPALRAAFGRLRLPPLTARGRKHRNGKHRHRAIPLLDIAQGSIPTVPFRGHHSEAYSRLRMNIESLERSETTKVIVVTSPLAQDGKTTSALNLAFALLERGRRVLIMDADLRRGTIGLRLGAAASPGLTELLGGRASVEQAVRQLRIEGLGVLAYMTSGALTEEPARMLASDRMRALCCQLREQYDVILLDSPPLNVVADAAVLGSLADGVLVVARAGVTAPEALAFTVEQLRNVRAPLLGAVLNDVDFRRDAAYDRSYRYYGHEYSD